MKSHNFVQIFLQSFLVILLYYFLSHPKLNCKLNYLNLFDPLFFINFNPPQTNFFLLDLFLMLPSFSLTCFIFLFVFLTKINFTITLWELMRTCQNFKLFLKFFFPKIQLTFPDLTLPITILTYPSLSGLKQLF